MSMMGGGPMVGGPMLGGGAGLAGGMSGPGLAGAAGVGAGMNVPVAPIGPGVGPGPAVGGSPVEVTQSVVTGFSHEQLYELMWEMKNLVQQNPEQARLILSNNPSLAVGLLDAQVKLGMVPHATFQQLLNGGTLSGRFTAPVGAPPGMSSVGLGVPSMRMPLPAGAPGQPTSMPMHSSVMPQPGVGVGMAPGRPGQPTMMMPPGMSGVGRGASVSPGVVGSPGMSMVPPAGRGPMMSAVPGPMGVMPGAPTRGPMMPPGAAIPQPAPSMTGMPPGAAPGAVGMLNGPVTPAILQQMMALTPQQLMALPPAQAQLIQQVLAQYRPTQR